MSGNDGYVVSCPCCGQVFNKSIITESRTKCKRCRTEFYTYLRNGVSINVDLDAGLGASDSRVRLYADRLIDFVTTGQA
ncbi:MAG: hypothetical protein IJH64_05335 [Oscillospiraceae bacterium]|nr:hypothetical protein [Oscillospiraceae bacterium]